jgi:dTDP-4-amino-4,6-dideoxygalactose transaminase
MSALIRPAVALRTVEQEFRDALGVRHIFLVSSGTAALVLVLKALAEGSTRRQVIIPAYSCYSVPAAVMAAGLQPVLCDIDRSDFGLDAGQLSRVIGPSTLAVVAQHLFGMPSAIDRIAEICRRGSIALVEDAAQAIGVTSNGRWLGTVGDAGIFSFGRGKHVTAGQGGMIATSSDRIAADITRQMTRLEQAVSVRSLGQLAYIAAMAVLIRPWLYWMPAAVPMLKLGHTIFPNDIRVGRLGGMRAGLLRTWKRRLQASNRARLANAAVWMARLGGAGANAEPRPYLRYPVLMRDADAAARLIGASRAKGLGISGGYPASLDALPQMRPFLDGREFPVARAVAARLVTLPTHHFVTERDRTAVVACFADVAARETAAA